MENETLKNDILKGVKELLGEQTTVILNSVDEKIRELDLRFSQKMDDLTTTLDNFLKRITDAEDEFAIMKADLNKVKKVIKEKLGVDLT